MYKLGSNDLNGNLGGIIRLSDNVCIPINENNTSYQEYLEWLSDGNIPEEAE